MKNNNLSGKQWRSVVVSKHCTLKLPVKMTLIAVAEFMYGNKDYAFPTMEGISELTGTPLRTVERHIATALKSGWLSRDQKKFNEKGSGWRRNIYYTSIPESVSLLNLPENRTAMDDGTNEIVPPNPQVVPPFSTSRTAMDGGLILNRSKPQVESSRKKQEKPQVSLVTLKDQGDASFVNVIKDETTVDLGLGSQETINVNQHSSGDTVIKLETTGTKTTLDSSDDAWKFFADMVPAKDKPTLDSSLASPSSPEAIRDVLETNLPQTTPSPPEASNGPVKRPRDTGETFGRWSTNGNPLSKKYYDSLSLKDQLDYLKSREKSGRFYCDHPSPQYPWAAISLIQTQLKQQKIAS